MPISGKTTDPVNQYFEICGILLYQSPMSFEAMVLDVGHSDVCEMYNTERSNTAKIIIYIYTRKIYCIDYTTYSAPKFLNPTIHTAIIISYRLITVSESAIKAP